MCAKHLLETGKESRSKGLQVSLAGVGQAGGWTPVGERLCGLGLNRGQSEKRPGEDLARVCRPAGHHVLLEVFPLSAPSKRRIEAGGRYGSKGLPGHQQLVPAGGVPRVERGQ